MEVRGVFFKLCPHLGCEPAKAAQRGSVGWWLEGGHGLRPRSHPHVRLTVGLSGRRAARLPSGVLACEQRGMRGPVLRRSTSVPLEQSPGLRQGSGGTRDSVLLFRPPHQPARLAWVPPVSAQYEPMSDGPRPLSRPREAARRDYCPCFAKKETEAQSGGEAPWGTQQVRTKQELSSRLSTPSQVPVPSHSGAGCGPGETR